MRWLVRCSVAGRRYWRGMAAQGLDAGRGGPDPVASWARALLTSACVTDCGGVCSFRRSTRAQPSHLRLDAPDGTVRAADLLAQPPLQRLSPGSVDSDTWREHHDRA